MSGQSDDIERIRAQETALVFDGFDESAAALIGLALRDTCLAASHPVSIDIRLWDRQLFFVGLPGTRPDHQEWIRRKSNVVRRFHRSSYLQGLLLAQDKGGQWRWDDGVDPADYATHGGAFPIRLSGLVIGAVTVSGLAQRQDHELVVEALCGYLGKDYAALRLPDAR